MFAYAAILAFNLWMFLTTANVEKTIFVTRESTKPVASLEHFMTHIEYLSPAQPVLKRTIDVSFPRQESSGTRAQWLLLDGLEAKRRYEVRICWSATQPTSFALKTLEPIEIRNSTAFLSSLEDYSNSFDFHRVSKLSDLSSPHLFLQISAWADYYSSSTKLMLEPAPVDVEIILDPFAFNLLPRTLISPSIYIVGVCLLAWLISGALWRLILQHVAVKEKRP